MPEFPINFADVHPNGRVFVHDLQKRKKALVVGGFAKVFDDDGHFCCGVIEMIDQPTQVIRIMLDMTTYDFKK